MRHQLHEDSGDAPLPRTEAAEELAALIQMTRFMAELVPRLVDDPNLLKAQLDRLEAELERELSLAQLHPASAAN
jgi:hypothetical protein